MKVITETVIVLETGNYEDRATGANLKDNAGNDIAWASILDKGNVVKFTVGPNVELKTPTEYQLQLNIAQYDGKTKAKILSAREVEQKAADKTSKGVA